MKHYPTLIFRIDPHRRLFSGTSTDGHNPTCIYDDGVSDPNGIGDSVSDFIDFSAWLTEPPPICAPP